MDNGIGVVIVLIGLGIFIWLITKLLIKKG